MPLYDCVCTKCGWTGEKQAKIKDRDAILCERCSYMVLRLPAAVYGKMAGTVLQGGGPDRFTADMLGIKTGDLPGYMKAER